MAICMRFLRDPLVVFLLIGGGIFLLYSAVGPEAPDEAGDPYRIEITGEIREILKAEWAARWNRPPTDQELGELVDEYIREEILYREATRLGLDQSDSVIRRRLAQKMEFLTSDIADMEEISTEKIEAYFSEKSERYEREPQVGFEHLFFSPEKRDDAATDAEDVLRRLDDGSITTEAAREAADRMRLSPQFAATAISQIGRQFGETFSTTIAEVEPGEWFGPVESNHGLHLVRVTESDPGGRPPLDSVRDKVMADYRFDQRTKLNRQMLEDLLDQYEVVIHEPGEKGEES